MRPIATAVSPLLLIALAAGCGSPAKPASEPTPQAAGGSEAPATQPAGSPEAAPAQAQDSFDDLSLALSPVPEAGDAAHSKKSAIAVLGITPPERPWRRMSKSDRNDYMVGKVLPIMKETFQHFDPLAFKKVECATCHGKDAKRVKFKMPNPALPKIAPPGTPGWADVQHDHPRMVHFMKATVTDRMAKLLGLDTYDPKTGKGFGCNSCHPHS